MATTNVPPFLNEEYFRKVLENGLEAKDVKIFGLKFSMGSSTGESFLGSIYRVVVDYTIGTCISTTSVSLIVKVVPYVAAFDSGGTSIHEKEVTMYSTILPEINEGFLDKRISPKAYYAALEDPKTLVLEDLKVSGYKLSDRQEGLDENHCKLVLQKVGKLHALSLLYAKKHPDVMTEFTESIMSEFYVKSEAFAMAHGQNYKPAVEMVQTWSGYESIWLQMKNILCNNTFADRLLNQVDSSKDTFRVLNHGDLWINNLLFKYGSDGKPIDVIFVDYQFSYYGSPGIDVNQFLAVSAAPEVVMEHHDVLVKEHYYASFKETLYCNGYENIPSEDFMFDAIRQKETFAVLIAIAVLPILMMDSKISDENTLDNVIGGKVGSKQKSTMLSPRFQGVLRYWLQRVKEL